MRLDGIYLWSANLPTCQRDTARRLFRNQKLSANYLSELLATVPQ